MRHDVVDLIGRRFGRLLVTGPVDRISGQIAWRCQCDCGSTKTIRAGSLVGGLSTSCGCKRKETLRTRWHGQAGTPLHTAWLNIRGRCGNPKWPCYPNYGGRGIRVCDRWRDSFEAFAKDMGPRPSPRHSIDRIDVNGNYEPGNCRWATRGEQARNTRANVLNKVAVDIIRHMAARGARTDDLSHAFGACRTTVNRVIARTAWSSP